MADDSGPETTEGSESQLEKRIGVLEWGLAARVQRAAESMSEIRFQREAEESRSAAVKEQVSRLEQEGCMVIALVKQVEAQQAELGSDLKVLQENTNQEIKHQRLWVQGEGGLKVTAAGLASDDEVGEDRQHEGQDGQPGG